MVKVFCEDAMSMLPVNDNTRRKFMLRWELPDRKGKLKRTRKRKLRYVSLTTPYSHFLILAFIS